MGLINFFYFSIDLNTEDRLYQPLNTLGKDEQYRFDTFIYLILHLIF